jgi:hypothetical protein
MVKAGGDPNRLLIDEHNLNRHQHIANINCISESITETWSYRPRVSLLHRRTIPERVIIP